MADTADTENIPQAEDQQEESIHFNTLYALFILGALALAVLAYYLPSPLKNIIHSKYGIFENTTVFFYLLAIGFGGWGAWKYIKADWQATWPKWGLFVLMALLAFIFLGEEFRWGIPFFYEDFKSWPIASLQDLLELSVDGVPHNASMLVVGLIAGVRLLFVLVLIYIPVAIFFLPGSLNWRALKLRRLGFVYAIGFGDFFLGALLLDARIIPGRMMFEEAFEMCASLSYLMMVMVWASQPVVYGIDTADEEESGKEKSGEKAA